MAQQVPGLTRLLCAELDPDLRVSWPRSHPAGSPNSLSTGIPSQVLPCGAWALLNLTCLLLGV